MFAYEVGKLPDSFQFGAETCLPIDFVSVLRQYASATLKPLVALIISLLLRVAVEGRRTTKSHMAVHLSEIIHQESKSILQVRLHQQRTELTPPSRASLAVSFLTLPFFLSFPKYVRIVPDVAVGSFEVVPSVLLPPSSPRAAPTDNWR